MGFWETTLTNLLGALGAALVFFFGYVSFQCFFTATDVVVSYGWKFGVKDGTFWAYPQFDIRNRSRSREYRLANIAYTIAGKIHWFDNEALWGKPLEPGSIHIDYVGRPIPRIGSTTELLALEVTVRLQTGRSFWLRGQGPGQEQKGKARRWAFKLRNLLENSMIPTE